MIKNVNQNVCFISGSAGFLGSQFCKFFSEKNYKVLCADKNKNYLKLSSRLLL